MVPARPVSWAHIAISTRLRAPSLAIRLAMCVLTVLSRVHGLGEQCRTGVLEEESARPGAQRGVDVLVEI